jgi:cell division protein FtsL
MMRGVLAKTMVIVGPLLAAALFYVWAEVTTVRMGYMMSQASDAHRTLLEENRGLRIEVAALRAPERLERLAIERYKLEAPKSEQVIRLEGSDPIVKAER